MYLFVFVFLIVGLLGIYTQVFAVQTARMFANQTGVAQLMATWHGGEVSLGLSVVRPPPATACSLTYGFTSVAYCTTNIPGNSNTTVTLNNSSGTVNSYVDVSANPYPRFPRGYNMAYTWNSVMFVDANNQRYVVTWAPMPASGRASDPITSPNIGINGGELFQQMRNAKMPLIGYGTVSGGVLRTPASASFTMPSAVPNGAVAMISMI